MTRHRLPALLLAAAAVAGCSASDSVESTEPAPTPSTVESTTTPDTTTPDTTNPDTTTTAPETTTTTTVPETSTTTVPETTTTVDTTATTEPPSTIAPGPAPTPPELAYVTGDTDLLQVEVATGATTATLVELFNGDGVFRGNLRLAPDGASLWFAEGYEDGWYGCDTSVGSFGRVDTATGALEIIGVGTGPEPSPDGTLVAYLDSGLCLPDPENPELWVLTPYDRVVVRDVASGNERVVVTEPAPEDDSSDSQVEWAGFSPTGELLVQTTDRRLRLVDPEGSGVLQDHPVVVEEVRGFPVGATDDWLITVDYGDEGSADVYAVDPLTGGATRLAVSEGFVTVGIAPNGAIVVTGISEVSVEPGAPVTVLTAPDGGTFSDVDW